MKKNAIVGLVTVGLLTGGLLALGAAGWRGSSSQGTAVGSLPPDVAERVLEALVGPEGEYAAYATYAAILDTYGSIQPYASILRSEAQHIAALQKLLARYGVEVPTVNPCLGQVEAPDSLLAAAQAGVDAEVANINLYDDAMDIVADYPDIVRVFSNLRTASLEAHLPAFERALENGGSL